MSIKPAIEFFRPTLVGSAFATDDQHWRMLDKVSHVAPYLAITPSILLICSLEWNSGASSAAEVWAITAVAFLALRCWVYLSYLKRSPGDSIAKWRGILSATVVAAGFQWGLGGFLVVDAASALTANAVLGLMICCIAAAATRLHVIPKAVIGQALACVCVASIGPAMAGKWELVGVLWAGFLYITCFIRSLARLERERLFAEQQNARLMETLAHSNAALAAANAQLEHLAMTDALTLLPNRRAFDVRLVDVAAAAARDGVCMAVLVIDIDHFKHFNDTYGHQAGDQCLAVVGHRLAAAGRRKGDLVARYGGEEFAAIMPSTTEAQAAVIAEEIRRAVEATDISHLPGAPFPITLSIGVAAVVPTPDFTVSDLVERADRALYRAKKSGRNRIETADGDIALDHSQSQVA